MKKVLFVFVIAVAMVVSSTSNAMNVLGVDEMFGTCVTNAEENVVGLTVDIDFGRGSKGCKGFGICKIALCVEIDFSSVTAHDDGAGNIVLIFPEKTYRDNINGQFANGMFAMEENYVMTSEVAKAFGANAITLLKGSYRVVAVTNGYEVKIKKG